jgi:hypothetical protein
VEQQVVYNAPLSSDVHAPQLADVTKLLPGSEYVLRNQQSLRQKLFLYLTRIALRKLSETSTVLTGIPEVSASNLGHDTDYPGRGSLWFSSLLQIKF